MSKLLLSNNDHKDFFLYTIAVQSLSNKKYPKIIYELKIINEKYS